MFDKQLKICIMADMIFDLVINVIFDVIIDVIMFDIDWLIDWMIDWYPTGECLRHLTQQAVVLQKKMNDIYQVELVDLVELVKL